MLQAKLELRQTQSLIITPQLQQAIKLLQLSNLDLISFLEREIEQNPLIDWEDRVRGEVPAASGTIGEAAPAESPPEFDGRAPEAFDAPEAQPAEAPGSTSDMGDFAEDAGHIAPAYDETLSLRSAGAHSGSADGQFARMEDFTAQPTTLRDHLRQQLHIAVSGADRKLIGDHLIDLIDDAGYLRGSVEDIAERLGADPRAVEEVLGAIHTFDPAGVGARCLSECLAIQLRELDRCDPAMELLLANLELLGNHEYAALQRICRVDHEDLSDMIAEIRALNPRPGTGFGGAAVETVIPDILVERDRAGEWTVQLNSDTLPRICVNHSFYSNAKRMVRTERDRTYLQGCMTTANWLARSLDQRRRTMLKVAREIVTQQSAFLDLGVRGLRPLALKDVAERIGMHEFDGKPRHVEQIYADPARNVRVEIFFHLRDRLGLCRRRAFLRSGQAPHQGDDRQRVAAADSVGRQDRRHAARRRDRHRPPDRRQISRGDAHPLFRAASAEQECLGPAFRRG